MVEKKSPDNPKHSSCRIPLLDSSSGGVLRKTLEGHLGNRKEGDSNSRQHFCCAPLPRVYLKPLGHLSRMLLIYYIARLPSRIIRMKMRIDKMASLGFSRRFSHHADFSTVSMQKKSPLAQNFTAKKVQNHLTKMGGGGGVECRQSSGLRSCK